VARKLAANWELLYQVLSSHNDYGWFGATARTHGPHNRCSILAHHVANNSAICGATTSTTKILNMIGSYIMGIASLFAGYRIEIDLIGSSLRHGLPRLTKRAERHTMQ